MTAPFETTVAILEEFSRSYDERKMMTNSLTADEVKNRISGDHHLTAAFDAAERIAMAGSFHDQAMLSATLATAVYAQRQTRLLERLITALELDKEAQA